MVWPLSVAFRSRVFSRFGRLAVGAMLLGGMWAGAFGQETKLGFIPRDPKNRFIPPLVADAQVKAKATSLLQELAKTLSEEYGVPMPQMDVQDASVSLRFNNRAKCTTSWPRAQMTPAREGPWQCLQPSDAQLAEVGAGAVWIGDANALSGTLKSVFTESPRIKRQKYVQAIGIGGKDAFVSSQGFSPAMHALWITIASDPTQTEHLEAFEVRATVSWARDGWLLLADWNAVCRREQSLEKATWERARDSAMALAQKVDAAICVGSQPSLPVWRSTRYEPGPAQLVVPVEVLNAADAPSVRFIPQGATVEMILRCEGTKVPNPTTEVRTSAAGVTVGNGAGGFAQGSGLVQRRKVMMPKDGSLVRVSDDYFTLQIAPDAPLGPVSFTLREADGKERQLADFVTICRPLVALIVVDGLRRELLNEALRVNPATLPILSRLTGKMTSPAAAGAGTRWTEFEHGLAFAEATTVFPSVTFAGNAAIFAGAELAALNMAGNEWFDRMAPKPYKYAFTGDNMGLTGVGDAHDSFTGTGTANLRLRASGIPTVYEDAARLLGVESIVHHSMYYGDGRKAAAWVPYSWGVDEFLYYLAPFTAISDTRMVEKAKTSLKRQRDWLSTPRSPNLGLLTLYFAGLDHLSHIGTDPVTVPARQKQYLEKTIDPALGEFFDQLNDAEYKNAFTILTADHGHSDMGPSGLLNHFGLGRVQMSLGRLHELVFECGYLPQGKYRIRHPRGLGGRESDPSEIVEESIKVSDPARWTAVVGLNAGMAHVYLRGLNAGATTPPRKVAEVPLTSSFDDECAAFGPWDTPPPSAEVLRVADYLRTHLMNREAMQSGGADAAYARSLDMILVRDAQHSGYTAAYQVYFAKGNLVPLVEHLRSREGEDWMRRMGWNVDDRDRAFIAARVAALQGPMSGDLVLLPRYPEFYCEYAEQHGDHGGLNTDDLGVPFVVVRPGEKDARALTQAVVSSIVRKPGKDRPMVTDIKPVALKLLAARAARDGLLPAPSAQASFDQDAGQAPTTPPAKSAPTMSTKPPDNPAKPAVPPAPTTSDPYAAIRDAVGWTGMVLALKGKPFEYVLEVRQVAEGSLADLAGIQAGDTIQTLMDEPVKTLTPAQIDRGLRPDPGTMVEMEIRRAKGGTILFARRRPKKD